MTDRPDPAAWIAKRRELLAAATEGPWEESWKQIPGFDGYEVSDFGNVRSYRSRGAEGPRAQFPRLLKALRGTRYPSVSIPRPEGGPYHNQMVHRLVMLAFVGPCPDGHEVAHLNGDHCDNRLSNLAYVTHRENESHKVAHGTSGHGEGNSNAILQGWQVEEIKFLAQKSIPQGKIAALFDIPHRQVGEILRGRSWAQTPARTSLPRALDALEAVLEPHQLHEVPGGQRWCLHCGADWPCPTVAAAETALRGES